MSRFAESIFLVRLVDQADLRPVALAALWAALLFGGAADRVAAQCAETAPALPAGEWVMVSLPCVPTVPTPAGVWGDDLPGVYGVDWIVYERDEANDVYVAMGETDELGLDAGGGILGVTFAGSQTVGYWIKTLDGGVWDVEGLPTAVKSFNSCGGDQCFLSMTTEPDGVSEVFNLMGYPHTATIPWADVRVVQSPGVSFTPTAAELNGLMDATFWKDWDSGISDYQSFDDVTPGMEGSLEAFDGFWIRVTGSAGGVIGTLLGIPDAPATPLQAEQRGALNSKGLRRGEWYIRLTAEAPADGLRDTGNVLGQLRGSTDGLDRHDLEALAPFDDDHMGIIFRHEDWGHWTTDFNSDYRAAKGKKKEEWPFIVRSGDPNRDIVLSWEGERWIGNSWLMDVKTGEVVKARRGGKLQTYSFNMDGELEREFVWAVVPR